MQVHLIVVGKLKDKNLESIESDYIKRINNPKLQIHEVKAKAENKELEGELVLKKATELSKGDNFHFITLSEFGKEFHSPEFSTWIEKRLEAHSTVVFTIAGANGHGQSVLDRADASISLSKLTFPHKIARVIFVEQFYRAQTIRTSHPYHN